MTIIGTAYSPWFFWDGRKDSLWSQALGPLEDPREQAGTRLQFAHLMVDDPGYRRAYTDVFGDPPDLSDSLRFPAEITGTTDRGIAPRRMSSRTDPRTIHVIQVFAARDVINEREQTIPLRRGGESTERSTGASLRIRVNRYANETPARQFKSDIR